MIEVDVLVEADVVADVDAMVADARAAIGELGLAHAELSIVLTDDAHITVLNQTWRSKSEPTDVLSFPQQDPGAVGAGHLGDIVISVPTAARQAAELGHPLDTELRVLLVHGLCHLMGHDHLEPEERTRMQALEATLLARLADGAAPLSLISRVHDS